MTIDGINISDRDHTPQELADAEREVLDGLAAADTGASIAPGD